MNAGATPIYQINNETPVLQRIDVHLAAPNARYIEPIQFRPKRG